MKKIVSLAVISGALPALLSGQAVTFNCPEERCQVAPYFAGSGGFVGESAGFDGEDEVTFSVVCGNTTITSSVEPDSDGIVRKALSAADRLNCAAGTSGTLEVDNLLPGGWYWINDDLNSAVSAFIPKEAVAGDQIEPTDPGGVILDTPEDGIGTFVKHSPTGRVGIIPHLVPTRPIKGCSGMVGTESAFDCHLGSPEDWRVTASPSSVRRPLAGAQTKVVTVTLYGENFVTTGAVYGEAKIEHHFSVQGILFNQTVGVEATGRQPGVMTWQVEVAGDDNRCLPANNDPDRGAAQTITFTVVEADGFIPDPPSETVMTTFTVNCPDASAAAAGAELVPENPFPPAVD